MISHRNVIANTIQISSMERSWRESLSNSGSRSNHTMVGLGLLPQSHIYALVVICHAGTWRGDQTIVLPKFDLESYLAAIQNYKIESLFVVSVMCAQLEFLRDLLICSPGASDYHHHASQSGCLPQI